MLCTFRLEVVFQLLQCATHLPNLVFPGRPQLSGRSSWEAHEEESDWHMKGLQPARMVAEDGPGKHCPHSAPSEEKKKKALYWKGKWPCWTWCLLTSLFFKPPSQQFPRLMNQIASSDLCLTVAVACRVINHRYCAAVDPHANVHRAIPPPCPPETPE